MSTSQARVTVVQKVGLRCLGFFGIMLVAGGEGGQVLPSKRYTLGVNPHMYGESRQQFTVVSQPPNLPHSGRVSGRQRRVEPVTLVQKLIKCESQGHNVEIIDTNGKASRGILQFQDETWGMFSRLSGINGSPMNRDDAVRMANWAVLNGFGHHWSCWEKVVTSLAKTDLFADSDEGNNVFRSDVDKDQSSAKLGNFMLTE